MSLEQAMKMLREKANPSPKNLEGMKRCGIAVEHRLCVSVPDLRLIAKNLGKNHELALALWGTGYADARILASMVDEPAKVSESQMDAWVRDFDSWDVCDQVCMNLFEKTPFARKKIREWSIQEETFVKRAAFALMACLACHNKQAKDEEFIELFPVIKSGAGDERNFVKKSVSWALRNIGKKNVHLNREAVVLAQELLQLDFKAARWIGSDAVRELESGAVQRRLRKSN